MTPGERQRIAWSLNPGRWTLDHWTRNGRLTACGLLVPRMGECFDIQGGDGPLGSGPRADACQKCEAA
jgi:hypothetical protein